MADADPRGAIRARAQSWGFDAVRFARATNSRTAPASISRNSSRRAATARWTGWRTTRSRRAAPASAMARSKIRHRRWRELCARTTIRCDAGNARTTAARSPSMRKATIITTCMKAKIKTPRRNSCAERFGAEVKVFVDTAPVMEKPLAQRSGARLARQAHQSRLARIRFVAVSRLDLHDARARARCARRRSLRDVPALSRCLPDRRLHRALSHRCAALHLLSHHRT